MVTIGCHEYRKYCIDESEVRVERLLDIALSFKINLKTGFYKTRRYELTIGPGQIILTPQEDYANGRLVINEADLQSISIIGRNVPAGELEIITHDDKYIATITDQACLEEIFNSLIEEFGNELIFRNGLF